ncbi:MAG: ABC transporter permease [Verrucomicrobiota bacterium]|nr:ABC transporter permease [Verrucomicrobiota bacterium]
MIERRNAWSRLLADKTARIAIGALATVLLLALAGPMLMPAHYRELTTNQFAAPSIHHWFGTDLNGRDLLYRVMEGARISLLVGTAGALISFFVGTAYGLIAGYAGGRCDALMMRAVEILYSIPRLIIVLVFINAFDDHVKKWLLASKLGDLVGYSKILILILSLGLIEWLTMARIVRGQVLALKSQQFIAAARSLGQSHFKIIVRHLLPNLAGVVIIYLTLAIPAVILDETFLSFLGLGIQAPQASWGSLLSDGAQVINPIRSNWWLLVFPAVVMSITLLSLNFLGDALRDALDPRVRR